MLRSRLIPIRDGIPGAYWGNELRPGVRGFVVGGLMLLGVAPPGRNLWSNRRSPVYLGRIVRRSDGGSDLRFAVYRQWFPYPAREDPEAERVFGEWLAGLKAELATPWLSAEQAAAYLGGAPVSRIYDLVQTGKLKPHRDGRRLVLHTDDLDNYLRASRDERVATNPCHR